jgi:hypothetical protein
MTPQSKGPFVKNRKREAFAGTSIIIGAAVLVVWIRGGFDAMAQRPGSPQQALQPLPVPFETVASDSEIIPPTGSAFVMLMMIGKNGLFSLPGVTTPPHESARATRAPDGAEVVGVCVNGQYRAFCLSEMGSPHTHVVNDVIDQVPVTVTYCNRSGCVRVFTKADDSHRPLDVGVGGFSNGQMVLQIDHKNFPQNSDAIPLQEMEFERTTWGEWKSAHPDSEICTTLPYDRAASPPALPDNNVLGRDVGGEGE